MTELDEGREFFKHECKRMRQCLEESTRRIERSVDSIWDKTPGHHTITEAAKLEHTKMVCGTIVLVAIIVLIGSCVTG